MYASAHGRIKLNYCMRPIENAGFPNWEEKYSCTWLTTLNAHTFFFPFCNDMNAESIFDMRTTKDHDLDQVVTCKNALLLTSRPALYV